MTGSEIRREAVSNAVRPWQSILVGFLLVLHGVIGSFVWFTPRFATSIATSAMAPELDLAYSTPINSGQQNPLYELPTDTNETPRKSKLVLLENGRALGPSHSLHAEIRQHGGGRYSYWNNSLIFSASDGSDPRANGRTYSVESPTVVQTPLRIAVSIALALADVIFFVLFQSDVLAFIRTRSPILLKALAFTTIGAATLSAVGEFGTIVAADGYLPEDTALCLLALQEAGLGCLTSIGMWAAGAGLYRGVLRQPDASLATILIPAFPVGLLLLAGLLAISLLVPHGRTVAFVLWLLCLLPLFDWRPPRHEIAVAVRAVLIILPFSITFGVWLGLLWHGPTQTLPGSPSGDLTYYVGTIWTLAEHPYPLLDLGYENGGARSYFNSVYPALGAALVYFPGFDPYLFLLAGGGTSYVLLTALMLHFYLRDRAPQTTSFFSVILLVLCFLVAARYPFWVAESIPLVFVPALTIAVWWMAERGERIFGWAIAAMVVGLIGSILSKVAAAAVLVPLGAAGLWRQFWLLSYSLQSVALAVAGALIGALFAWTLYDGVDGAFGNNVFKLTVSPALIGMAILWAMGVALLGGLLPSIRAARRPVVEALRAT